MITCTAGAYKVEGTGEDEQTWAGMAFSEPGSCILEEAHPPVAITVESDRPVYNDPNVCMRHEVKRVDAVRRLCVVRPDEKPVGTK